MAQHFPLDLVPSELLPFIIQKMKVEDFSRFQRANKAVYEICHQRANFIHLQLMFMHVGEKITVAFPRRRTRFLAEIWGDFKVFRVHIVTLLVTVDLSEKVLNEQFFLAEMFKIRCLERLVVDSAEFSKLVRFHEYLQLIKTPSLSVNCHVSPDSLPPRLLNELSEVHLDATSDYNDEQLWELKAQKIRIRGNNISDHGVNRFLHQWSRGERIIVHFGVSGDSREEDIVLRALDNSVKLHSVEDSPRIRRMFTKEWEGHGDYWVLLSPCLNPNNPVVVWVKEGIITIDHAPYFFKRGPNYKLNH